MTKTIYDIARIAGVSATTVSRVINNNYPVRKETREVVEKVISEEGYTPNLIAKGLITKTTFSIGVVVPGITNIFFPSIVEEINSNLVNEGFVISLYTTSGDFYEEKSVIDNIISRSMDGVFVIDPSPENINNGYLEKVTQKIPTLIINGKTDNDVLNFLSYDEEVGTRQALDYLTELGHSRILFIRGLNSLSYDLRQNAYHDFIKDNKLNYEKIISVGWGNTAEVVKETEDIIKRMITEGLDATAVFACNDLMAVGALNGFIKEGINVPEDVSIIGFDNTLVSGISSPRLTTVDIDEEYIGKRASEIMLEMLNRKVFKTEKVVFDTKLIRRESCMKRK